MLATKQVYPSFSKLMQHAGEVLIFSSFFIIQPGISEVMPARDINKIAREITVLIDSHYPGSGVISHENKNRNNTYTYSVITAYHVVKHSDLKYTVVAHDGKRYPVDYKTVKRLGDVDLAVLQFTSDRPYKTATFIDSSTATPGSDVYIAGFPKPSQVVRNSEYAFEAGRITSVLNEDKFNGYGLVYSNNTRSGMSGGPVLDSMGRVVGIHGLADSDPIPTDKPGQVKQQPNGRKLGIPINTFTELASRAGIRFKLSFAKQDPPSPQPSYSVLPPSGSSPASRDSGIEYIVPETKGPKICAGAKC